MRSHKNAPIQALCAAWCLRCTTQDTSARQSEKKTHTHAHTHTQHTIAKVPFDGFCAWLETPSVDKVQNTFAHTTHTHTTHSCRSPSERLLRTTWDTLTRQSITHTYTHDTHLAEVSLYGFCALALDTGRHTHTHDANTQTEKKTRPTHTIQTHTSRTSQKSLFWQFLCRTWDTIVRQSIKHQHTHDTLARHTLPKSIWTASAHYLRLYRSKEYNTQTHTRHTRMTHTLPKSLLTASAHDLIS